MTTDNDYQIQVFHYPYKKGGQYFLQQREFSQDDSFCQNNSTKTT